MRLIMCVLVLVCFLFSSVLGGHLDGTDTTRASDPIRSPTYGERASKFLSGCEIYFLGEYLEPIEGPDGEMGYLIEKTDSAVTINGLHYGSPYDPPRKRVRPPNEEANHRAAIFEKAMEEIRLLAEAHPSLENAYFIDGVLYTDTLQPYTTDSGETVMLRFHKEWGCLVYEDAKLSFEIEPYPLPPKEERDKQGLDIVYNSLAGSLRPGFIFLIGRGHQSMYPLAEAPALKAALAKIPALAQRQYKDMYGEWIYDSLTIDGYFFGLSIVAEFAEK